MHTQVYQGVMVYSNDERNKEEYVNSGGAQERGMLRHTQTTRVLAGLQEGIQERKREVYIDYSPHTLLEWRS